MKRYLGAIFALLYLVFILVGCGSKAYDKYTSLITDSVNNEYSVDAETDFWTGTYFRKNAIADQSCTVLGKTYYGSYSKSIVSKMNSYTTDIYIDADNIEYGLRDDTHELAYINLMNADFFNTQPFLPEIDDSYESAILYATEIASQYVKNISDYTQIIEDPVTRYKERDGITHQITYYVVTFAKKVNGYFSSDYIAVKVTSKGTLASIMMGDINAFDSVTINFDLATVDNSIANKIKSAYGKKLNNVQTNVEDQKIVLTPNGDICLYSNMEITGTDTSNSDIKTGVSILTVLGKKSK